MKKYCADFETTTISVSESESHVGLGYIEEFNQEEGKLGLTINEFFDYLNTLTEGGQIFFHNLEGDGEFLLHYLTRNAIPCQLTTIKNRFNRDLETGEELKENMFYIVKDCTQILYEIKWKNILGFSFSFRCSLKILRKSVAGLMGVEEKEVIEYDGVKDFNSIEEVPQNEIDYIYNDVRVVKKALKGMLTMLKYEGLTISSRAMKDFKKRIEINGKSHFEDKIKGGYFNSDGEFVEGEGDKFKLALIGGYCYVNAKESQLYEGQICVYDVNSLYPYVMYDSRLPYGEAIYECEGNCNHLQLIRGYIDCKLKNMNGCGFIPDRFGYENQINGLKEAHCQEIFMTKEMLNHVYKWYNVSYFKQVERICFQGKSGMFKKFFDEWQKVKQNSPKKSSAYEASKVVQNSIYGKTIMGYKRNKFFFRPLKEVENVRKERIYGEGYLDNKVELSKPSYIPLGIGITSNARIITTDLANTISSFNCPNCSYLYSDTDSVHTNLCDKHLSGLNENYNIDPKKLGAGDLEGVYKYGFYIRRKFYIEFNDINSTTRNIGCSGIDKREIKQYTNLEIIKGEYKQMKCMKKKVVGGVVLIKKELKK